MTKGHHEVFALAGQMGAVVSYDPVSSACDHAHLNPLHPWQAIHIAVRAGGEFPGNGKDPTKHRGQQTRHVGASIGGPQHHNPAQLGYLGVF